MTGSRHPTACFVTLVILISLLKTPMAEGDVTVRIEGSVQDAEGNPIRNAKILLWGFRLETETTTDRMGHFELEARGRRTLLTFHTPTRGGGRIRLHVKDPEGWYGDLMAQGPEVGKD